MRKSTTVKIDDQEITIKELRVKDIRKLLKMAEKEEEDILEQAETLLPMVTDIKPEKFENMAPSELKVLWEGFKEVNADFLSLFESLGIAEGVKNLIQKHLTEALADLSSEGIPGSGSTDGASS